MKPALKAGFVLCPTSTNVTAGQAVLQSLCFKENIKDLRFHPSFCPLNNIVFVN
jgi:hypothetical protein